MSSNKKPQQAFPGRTGMGYEKGLSKLEYTTIQIYCAALAGGVHGELEDFVTDAKQLLEEIASQETK
jgi:hypothetical protein